MWNACNKMDRLKKAMEMRGVNPESFSLYELSNVLAKRGITDTQLNPIAWTLITLLEPPGCYMTHCEHYGNSGSPMNCADGKIPGRCKINKTYKKRKLERKRKKIQSFIEQNGRE